MTNLSKNVEEMLSRLAENARTEQDFVRTLSDALRRVDEQLLRDVRNVSLQHELRREAILGELQELAVRLCALPVRGPSPAVTTIDQTNNGTRFKVIPGARILNAVTMISIAAINPEISVNVIICAQISTRFPGE